MTPGAQVALTLSDAFCVDRYRAEFLDLIRNGTVDIVFANERELHSLYQTADFDTAVDALRNDARLAVITRSEKGCLVVTREQTEAVPATPIEHDGRCDRRRRPVRGRVPGRASRAAPTTATAARLGALAAAEVIQHIGARPETSLKALAEAERALRCNACGSAAQSRQLSTATHRNLARVAAASRNGRCCAGISSAVAGGSHSTGGFP